MARVSNSSPRLRLAGERDVRALVEMRHAWTLEDASESDIAALRPQYGDEAAAFFSDAISSGHWQMWVAELDGRVVSHLSIALIDKVPRPTRPPARIAYLTNVYTVPEWRGRGIGTALLREAQGAVLDEAVELVIVWPSDESVRFYERAGFTRPADTLVWEVDIANLS